MKRRQKLVVIIATSILGLVLVSRVSLVDNPVLLLKRNVKFRPMWPSYFSAESKERLPAEELSPAQVCSPQDHVMFLKTHKCASTTLQNLFLRYGVLRSLAVAIPERANYFGHPTPFKANMVPQHLLSPSGTVDIFAIHSRLNVPEFARVLPPDTSFVTVVRDPGSQFESMYGYYRFQNIVGRSLHDFLKLPLEEQVSYRVGNGRIGPNSMLFDMGVAFKLNSTDEIRRAVQRIDETFDLVMIVEKLDESLILLKQLLCWEYEDILIFIKNSREESNKLALSEDDLNKIRKLNKGDVYLYNHFLAKHRTLVHQYGQERMVKEVAHLQALRMDAMEECQTQRAEYDLSNINWLKEHLKQGDISTNNYSKRNQICWMLLQSELPLIESIRNLQNSGM